ncbi:glycosyltransferase [Flaviramulus sp. BrNp1-15]|uniref:glycosyltransferase n=1 Tax=Flaviramulus sp. BrNp1-15 TaxID=2916754 RepID=UPI001EE874C0|nr:glycosyltransferase [Flaviramulus sp. BrNp1-15]ULC60585.1 glycosyltransferase [Flaviramulus sp. BrNp1-15]
MRVLQLIDSLQTGGAERVAVNIANGLSNNIEGSFLCATRKEGLLKESLSKKVKYLFLKKTSKFDFVAIKRLNKFIKVNHIQIIHAHSSSFFLATLIKFLNKKVIVIWHDHYGNSEFLAQRKHTVLKPFSKCFSHVFSVNKSLEGWAIQKLKVKNVTYLPNFAKIDKKCSVTNLNGVSGKRIVCLANLREQKDYITLLKAFKEVHQLYPDWSLHCIGKNFKDNYSKLVEEKIKTLNLEHSVFLYGSKPDIYNFLSQCEIGVLSSKSEGLPIALLEYGLSNLAVVATKVGECETVIDNKVNGLLVNPCSTIELANAIVSYIKNENMRLSLANKFNQHIVENYSLSRQLDTIIKTYNIYLK